MSTQAGLPRRVLVGDCLDLMAQMPPGSVQAVVTDPPYELDFMGHGWDRGGVSFDSKTWRLAYDVLVPGGFLLAFGGSRTYHRLACAIEDAGFEVRDSIIWMYSSGMPKSQDVGKVLGKRGNSAAKDWAGWGTGLKPAFEPIVVARRPFVGAVADNVLAHGTGALHIDSCRVASTDERLVEKYASVRKAGLRGNGVYGDDPKPRSDGRLEPHPGGRWPANVVLSHDPACRVVGTKKAKAYVINRFDDGAKPFGGGAGHAYTGSLVDPGTEEIWECAPGCPVALLDEQSGRRKANDEGGASRCFNRLNWEPELDAFVYFSKANTREREVGLDESFPPDGHGRRNTHTTVKPVALMRHLVRLVTPPGGTVLDPFCGSGTTGMACAIEGFGFVGMELDRGYARIARARIAHAEATVRHAA